MKRIFAILLASLALFSLVACQEPKAEDSSSEPSLPTVFSTRKETDGDTTDSGVSHMDLSVEDFVKTVMRRGTWSERGTEIGGEFFHFDGSEEEATVLFGIWNAGGAMPVAKILSVKAGQFEVSYTVEIQRYAWVIDEGREEEDFPSMHRELTEEKETLTFVFSEENQFCVSDNANYENKVFVYDPQKQLMSAEAY